MSAAAEAVLTANRELASGGVRFAGWLARGLAALRQLGPYAAIELILPGGSLIALLLWLYRRHKSNQSRMSVHTSNTKKWPASAKNLTFAWGSRAAMASVALGGTMVSSEPCQSATGHEI